MSHTEITSISDRIAVAQERGEVVQLDRNAAIAAIRAALKRRSGKTWSVTGGKGTAWGWIKIDAPPRRRTAHWHPTDEKDAYGDPVHKLQDTGERGGYMTEDDRAELSELLSLGRRVHHQGHDIAASRDHYINCVQRAEGRTPTVHGRQYWD